MRNRTEDQIEIVMIRHGATPANREHRYLGKTDESLSEDGKKELKDNKKMYIYPEVSLVFTSPMKRCVETAELLYPETEKVVVPQWEEMDFGEFEGKNYLELKGNRKYQEWIDSNGTLPFPKGESREIFIKRCMDGFQKMLDCENLPEKMGLVVHGGTIMAILSSLYGGEYFDYQLRNGQGYRAILCLQEKNMKIVDLKKL